MSTSSRLISFSLLLLAIFFTSACTKKETPSAARQVRVSATRAYEQYFGPAPTIDKGTCFAFVIYFPSAKDPGKVIPFPFFTFDEGSIKKVAVERLIGGMEVGRYKGEFLQPFPLGTRLIGISENNGMVTVNFSKEILNGRADAKGEKALLDALALTVSQFKEVKGVRVQVDGRERGAIDGREVADFLGHGGLKRQPLPIDEAAAREPGVPVLLSVTALRDKGAKNVEDVSTYFDRPVNISEFQMFDGKGKALEGEVFHSVFDMAAVLKPKEPGIFKEGMAIRVRWKVVDKMGRRGEGEREIPLEVKEH